jgi:hypothetical protein
LPIIFKYEVPSWQMFKEINSAPYALFKNVILLPFAQMVAL